MLTYVQFDYNMIPKKGFVMEITHCEREKSDFGKPSSPLDIGNPSHGGNLTEKIVKKKKMKREERSS